MRIVRNFIDGRYEEPSGDPKYPVYNPALGEQIAVVAEAKRDDLNRAVDLAFDAQRKWMEIPVPQLLQQHTILWAKATRISHLELMRNL